MNSIAKLTPILLLAVAGACYHAVIETGLAPGSQTIEQPWAMSFVDGLVPPSLVETKSRCPAGVSKVETQHSFLNMLVGGLTFGIVTPMSIKVTCAQGGRASATPTQSQTPSNN